MVHCGHFQFQGRHLKLPSNIKLGDKCVGVANTLAYHKQQVVDYQSRKSFIGQPAVSPLWFESEKMSSVADKKLPFPSEVCTNEKPVHDQTFCLHYKHATIII